LVACAGALGVSLFDAASSLRHIVASIDPTIAVSSARSLDDVLATVTAPARLRTMLLVAFSLVALAMASIGLYGSVAQSVSQRTAEIGVRVALGARARDVMLSALGGGLAVAAAGVTIGLPIAFATNHASTALCTVSLSLTQSRTLRRQRS